MKQVSENHSNINDLEASKTDASELSISESGMDKLDNINFDVNHSNTNDIIYPEFESFIVSLKAENIRLSKTQVSHEAPLALDINCGVGINSTMLAKHDYHVTGLDFDKTKIEVMLDFAHDKGLSVNGIVSDCFSYYPSCKFDAIVFNHFFKFNKASINKEIVLLNRMVKILKDLGFFFIFIPNRKAKIQILHQWINANPMNLRIREEGVSQVVIANTTIEPSDVKENIKEESDNYQEDYIMIIQRVDN